MNPKQLNNLADCTELHVEQVFSNFAALVGEGAGFVTREATQELQYPLALSLRGQNFSIDLAEHAEAKLQWLKTIVQTAKTSNCLVLHPSEVTAKPYYLRTKSGKKILFAAVPARSEESQLVPKSPARGRLSMSLASTSSAFNDLVVILGCRFFKARFERDDGKLILHLGEEIMETATLTCKALVGSIQIPLEDLVKLRQGSSFTLGALQSLDAIFEVEGVPYAEGRLLIDENGLVRMETSSLL